jgi:hypothetical protein
VPTALRIGDVLGERPLHVAARFNDLDVVQYVAKAWPGALFATNDALDTPYYVARMVEKKRAAAWLRGTMDDAGPFPIPREIAVAVQPPRTLGPADPAAR